MPTDLHWESLIAPITHQEFVDTIQGCRFALFKSVPSRPQLLNWETLEAVLVRVRFPSDRLQLFRNGKPYDRAAYLTDLHHSYGARVRTAALVRHLRDGATLILNNAEELFDDVGAIAESLTASFRTPTWANMYLGFGGERGFDLHWDTHDTLITQVIGRKHWAVYQPTESHPIEKSRVGALDAKNAQPVMNGLLQAGDTLYMPRGWWHVATPVNEPSLHFTFGMNHPTGLDLLHRLVDTMAQHEEARRDLPMHATVDEQRSHMKRLADLFERRCTPDAIEAHYRELEQQIVRPRLNLPTDVMRRSAPVDSTPLVLAERHHLTLAALDDGNLEFQVNERAWRVPASYRGPLSRLSSTAGITTMELVQMLEPASRMDFRAVLTALVMEGVVVSQ